MLVDAFRPGRIAEYVPSRNSRNGQVPPAYLLRAENLWKRY